MRRNRSSAGGAVTRLLAVFAVALAASAIGASGAAARWIPDHGQLLIPGPHTALNTNTSNNWFGYNLGAVERGGTLFHQISGSWTVPTATQHTAGQAENSADWIGIGGGCVDAGCTVGDQTLIQTGTEQDVSATGQASYDAWWEIIPVPETIFPNLAVHPGDRMTASISDATAPEVWTITLTDDTTGQTATQTVPYPSSMDTAEWIEETPLEIGTGGTGLAALPNLTSPSWSGTQVNGAPANLKTSEEMDLVDSSGNVIGAPSAPGSDDNSFNECTWASTCSAP